VGNKIDPTPGSTTSGTYSEMIFTNIYVKNQGGDHPESPDPANESSLMFIKTVTGNDTGQYFNFTARLDLPSIVLADSTTSPSAYATPAGFLAVYILEGGVTNSLGEYLYDPTNQDFTTGSTIVSDYAPNNIAGYNTYLNDEGAVYMLVPVGETFTFALKAGQRLNFIDAPVGTSYSITEAATPSYIASAVVFAGTTPGTAASAPGVDNTALSITGQRIADYTGFQTAFNAVWFTNTGVNNPSMANPVNNPVGSNYQSNGGPQTGDEGTFFWFIIAFISISGALIMLLYLGRKILLKNKK
jgi:hypothetical protein